MNTIRLATFNANNLFQRAAVLQLEGFNATTRTVLQDIETLNGLLAEASYAGAVGTQIKSLLEKYDQHVSKATPNNAWFSINQIRNKLFSVTKNPAGVKITANGRGDWLGWVELKREVVHADSTQNTGRVLAAVHADVQCLVEVEDRLTLERFNSEILKPLGQNFAHNLLVDGNDSRGIDVGLYSQFEIRSVRSHIDEKSAGGKSRLFSRDCPEFEVILPNGKTLWVLVNHFKSQGYGTKSSNDKRRKAQADKVCDYLKRFDLAKDLVVVAGDFNDQPDDPPVQPLQRLLSTPNLKDVLDSPKFGSGPRWTYGGKQQIDFVLVSKPLFAGIASAGIERHGLFSKTNFGGQFPHFPEVKDAVTQASDHAAVWAEVRLP
jgi:endonuclease/exonuclease/phosphatase family metal-dependent hydrolase